MIREHRCRDDPREIVAVELQQDDRTTLVVLLLAGMQRQYINSIRRKDRKIGLSVGCVTPGVSGVVKNLRRTTTQPPHRE